MMFNLTRNEKRVLGQTVGAVIFAEGVIAYLHMITVKPWLLAVAGLGILILATK